ncbi:MAG: zinc-binding alcohol dehydrogenase family protein [Chthonomonadales bacterium]
MKTLILDEPGRFRLTTTDPPGSPAPGEALIRVKRIGICGTDLHAYRGKQPFFTYPRILGHELGVEVVEVGVGVQNVSVGDICAVEPYLNCGSCFSCRNGKTNCCASLQVLGVHTDGGMRELILVPARKLHPSKKLTLEQLALVETLGIGAHAVQRAEVKPGETVLVFGAGPIGLTVMTFAKITGARVIAADVNAGRLEFAKAAVGIEETILVGDNTLSDLEKATNGDLSPAVFDATGNPQSMMGAFQFVSFGGRLTFVGLFQGDVTFNDPFFHRRELTLLSSRNATPSDFTNIIKLMESGEIDTNPWITHQADIADVEAKFPDWLLPESKVIKALVHI